MLLLTLPGSFIPEGTDVFVHTYTVHRDARNFSNPDTFWPERWLPPNDVGVGSRGKITHNASAFIPFSSGPSNCVGKALALQELRMVVCAVVQRFSMRFADCYRAESWEESLRDVNITMSGRLLSVLQERRSPSDS
jgi:cytochrome P450